MAFFPSTVATLVELLDAKNNTNVVLDGNHDAVVTTLNIVDTSNIPTAGRLTFEDGSFEVVSYTGKTATTLTGVSRGVDGTTAAAHSDLDTIGVFQSAKYHNILTEEIQAIEQNISDRFELGSTTVVMAAGNVGVGTASFTPLVSLHVQTGGVAVSPDGGADEFMIEGSSGGVGFTIASPNTAQQFIAFADPENSLAGQIRYSHANDAMQFYTAVTLAIDIDSSGNVGIGTSSQDGRLHVQEGSAGAVTASAVADQLTVESSGTAGAGISILVPATGISNIFFGDTSSALSGFIQYDHTANSLLFGVNAGGALLIDGSKNLHVQPFGAADVELEVSDGSVLGNGNIHRATSAVHSSETLKRIFRTLGRKEEKQASDDLLAMPIKEWEFRNAAKPQTRWGPTWETAPESIRDDHHKTLVIDDRIVQVEMSGKDVLRRLMALEAARA